MHCAFIVQASSQIGVGHLMRCMALAQCLDSLELEASFLLDQATSVIAKQRHDWCGQVVNHDYSQPLAQQIESVLDAWPTQPNWLIIDGYQFDQDFIDAWRKKGFKVVVFDDGGRVAPEAEIVIAASDREVNINQVEVFPIRLNGNSYRLLREDFARIIPQPLDARHTLTICFGGSDPLGITLPLLIALEQNSFSGPIRVVTGSAFEQLDSLNVFISQSMLSIQHIHNAQDMADIWNNARLAVSAAGGSQFELAVCETPSILVTVAENQHRATHFAQTEGWCRVVDFCDSSCASGQQKIEQLCTQIEMLWRDERQLEKMQFAVRGKYDAHGAERVIQVLSQYA